MENLHDTYQLLWSRWRQAQTVKYRSKRTRLAEERAWKRVVRLERLIEA